MIISLHLPKTAGSSFASSLSDHFGEKFHKDYSDLPLHHSNFNRNSHAILQGFKNYSLDEIQCIHGHFLPLKYRFYRGEKRYFITWMREPTERLASQYYYMKRHYTPEKAKTQPLLKKMIDESWSLERFCLGNEFKNTYTKFLWGFPLTSFAFIGIVEHYEADLGDFSSLFLKTKLKYSQENVNPRPKKQSYFKDNNNLRNKILQFHAKDMELYKNALLLRQERIAR